MKVLLTPLCAEHTTSQEGWERLRVARGQDVSGRMVRGAGPTRLCSGAGLHLGPQASLSLLHFLVSANLTQLSSPSALFSWMVLLDQDTGRGLRFDRCLPFSFLKGNTGNVLEILLNSRISFSLGMRSKAIIISWPCPQGCSLTLGGGQVTFPPPETSAMLTPGSVPLPGEPARTCDFLVTQVTARSTEMTFCKRQI